MFFRPPLKKLKKNYVATGKKYEPMCTYTKPIFRIVWTETKNNDKKQIIINLICIRYSGGTTKTTK